MPSAARNLIRTGFQLHIAGKGNALMLARRVALFGVACVVGGCSDAEPAPSKAALRLNVTSLGQCHVTNQNVALPNEPGIHDLAPGLPNSSLAALPNVIDGEDGTVDCAVTQVAEGTYDVRLVLRRGRTFFHIEGMAAKGGDTAGASVSIQSPETDELHGTNCTMRAHLDNAASGAILASFRCDGMVNEQFPGRSCRSDGTFVVDRCGS